MRSAIKKMAPLCYFIMRGGLAVSAAMILSFLLLHTHVSASVENYMIFRCLQTMPLLTFMIVSLSIAGAFMIDIYDKTQNIG